MKNIILRLKCATHKFADDLEKVACPPNLDWQRIHEVTVELERSHQRLVQLMNQSAESNNAAPR